MTDEIDLRQIWADARAQWRRLALITVACTLAAAAYFAVRTRSFEASLALQAGRIGRQQPSLTQAQDLLAGAVWPAVLNALGANTTDLRAGVIEAGDPASRFFVLRVWAPDQEQARTAIRALGTGMRRALAVPWRAEAAQVRSGLRSTGARVAARLRRLRALRQQTASLRAAPAADVRDARLLLLEMQRFDERRRLREDETQLADLRTTLGQRRSVRFLAPPSIRDARPISFAQSVLTGVVFGLTLSVAWLVARPAARH